MLTTPARTYLNKIKPAFLHTKYIYVFRIILAINNYVFPKPVQQNDICNWHEVYLLKNKNWIL